MIDASKKFNISKHLSQKQIELSDSILNKPIIYLDTKYWVILKMQSAKTDPKERKLFDLVLALVESGKCVFPISEITFWEVLKHTKHDSLKSTIEIIDKISKGLSFVISDEMKHLEIKIFFDSLLGKDVTPLKSLVWTKLYFAVFPGLVEDFLAQMPNHIPSIIAVIEKCWNSSFDDVYESFIKNPNYKPFNHTDNTEYLNAQKKIHENSYKDFKDLFLQELSGYLKEHDQIFGEVMVHDFFEQSGKMPTEEELKGFDYSKIRNAAFYAFYNDTIGDKLPSFHIFSGIFASIRWNKTQKHDKNDTIDSLHASFALPNCNFFFTEKSLATLITQNHTGYDKLYSCKVISSEKDALEILSNISPKKSCALKFKEFIFRIFGFKLS